MARLCGPPALYARARASHIERFDSSKSVQPRGSVWRGSRKAPHLQSLSERLSRLRRPAGLSTAADEQHRAITQRSWRS